MALTWRAAYVDLVNGRFVNDADGKQVNVVRRANVAIDGAFVHIVVPGTDVVQVVSSTAVSRLVYRFSPSTPTGRRS